VNFWRKDRRRLRLNLGDHFYFKPKGTLAVAGRGIFQEQVQLTIEQAWKRFGLGNGAGSIGELEQLLEGVFQLDERSINCLVLDNLEILPSHARPLLRSEDFPRGIQNGKFFEAKDIAYIASAFA
jgi:hypothetical protein